MLNLALTRHPYLLYQPLHHINSMHTYYCLSTTPMSTREKETINSLPRRIKQARVESNQIIKLRYTKGAIFKLSFSVYYSRHYYFISNPHVN